MTAVTYLQTKDNQKIAFTHYKKGNDKVVIIVHGFYNSKDSVLLQNLRRELLKRYDIFMFDLRGHGQSSGQFTWTSTERSDLEAVLDCLREKYSKTAIIAFSIGGSIAINTLAASESLIDSFICISAPSDCSRIDYIWWQLDFENDVYYTLLTKEGRKGKGARMGPFWLPKEKPINNIGKIKTPILFLHGDRDWIVGKWHSEALYNKAVCEKKLAIIENGPHAEYLLRKYPDKIYNEIASWFEKIL